MEFWGIEIRAGSPITVELKEGYLIHLSQITLGESMKVKDDTVPLYVKVGDNKQKLIIGNLSQNIPQASLDIFFEQDFELSHECKSSSVFALGYKTPNLVDEELGSDSSSDEEEIPMNELEKSNANGLKDQKANLEADESDSDDSDSDEMGSDDDSDDSDDSDEDEDDPLKVEPASKKTPNGGAMNNTNASKNSKVGVAQKPSGRHKGHNMCGGLHPPKRN